MEVGLGETSKVEIPPKRDHGPSHTGTRAVVNGAGSYPNRVNRK